jgi:cytochrome c553
MTNISAWIRACLTAVALCVLTSGFVTAAESEADVKTFVAVVQPLLKNHCVRCHGEKKQEAGLRVDRLGADLFQEKSGAVWQEIADRVNLGEMPPKNEPPLSRDELTRLNGWIAREQQRATALVLRTGGRVVLRRLNRAEYRNTIRDLLGVNHDAAQELPEDPAAHGFDNIGAALSVSPLHMEKYLRAARKAIDLAIVTGDQPPRERWRFQAERRNADDRGYYYANDTPHGNLPNRKERGRYVAWTLGGGVSEHNTAGFEHLAPVVADEYRTQVLRAINFTYPSAGEYIVRVRAFGHYPGGVRPDDFHCGLPRLNVASNGIRVLVSDVEATRDAPTIYEARYFSDAVTTTVFVRNRYDFSVNQTNQLLNQRLHSRDPKYPKPYMAVDWYEIDGPIYDSWPPRSHQRLLFPSKNRDDEKRYAREVLVRFIRRAYRRPSTDAEIDRLIAAFVAVRPNKQNFEEAIKVPLIAVLCSPEFLYLSEPRDQDTSRPLSDHELAARMSYFLWSSMPDDELFRLAESGRLRDDRIIDEQVARMLKDPKSREFVKNFTGQWLGLRQLGRVVPDQKLFPLYDEHLQESFAGETESFFAELLDHDRSVLQFIDADFTMLNERLARFYDIPGVKGDYFRKVALKPEHQRGGVLTQGSVLTITSNGTRTSPVKRGLWILENLLADPPPPPPPDAGEIQPQVPGVDKATVRQRLAIHRSVAACAACHAKIDPLGFALENYDASGHFRRQESSRSQIDPYPRDPAIDAHGELPNGRTFQNVRELNRLLLQDEDRFLNCLCEKLLVYALGRGLEFADRDTVRHLGQSVKRDDYRLRGLIANIIKTEAFRTK